MLAVMVVAGIGFARMHRVPAWKGVAATLTHVGGVVFGLLAAMVLFLALVSSKANRNQFRPVAGRLEALQVHPDMSPETVLTRHVDQARITLNALARPGVTPETAVQQALAELPVTYAPAANPYDLNGAAFCLGAPRELGQVGLTPLHDFHDPITHYSFKAGVSVEAWTENGRTRRFVTFGDH
jgi:hypothetical protein